MIPRVVYLKSQMTSAENLLIECEIPVPDVPENWESPCFKFRNCTWRFLFKRSLKVAANKEMWTIKLRKELSDGSKTRFVVAEYVRDRYGKLIVFGVPKAFAVCREAIIYFNSFTSIVNTYRYMGINFNCKLFFQLSSDFRCVDGTMECDSDFPDDIKNSSEALTQDKLIQTPSWMEVGPCMESLSMDFKKLLDANSQHDVTLNCNDHMLSAHSLVLSARSEVFRSMLQNDMLEKARGSIDIVDMELSVLDQFIKYLYSGDLGELTIDTAIKLYETCDKYSVPALRKRCCEFLKGHLNEEIAYRLIILADSHSDQELKDCTASFIIEKEILQKDDKWDNFCHTHPNVAIEVLNKAYKALKPPKKKIKKYKITLKNI